MNDGRRNTMTTAACRDCGLSPAREDRLCDSCRAWHYQIEAWIRNAKDIIARSKAKEQ